MAAEEMYGVRRAVRAPAGRPAEILSLDPRAYERHALHTGERTWPETNCYVDLWIEVLHAFGFDPTACLAFTVSGDFEGDQWLFFKPPTADLSELYGVDVQELTIWRDLLSHAVTQLGRKRLVLAEVDAYYLPDTQGVSYRAAHTKTTVAIQHLDTERQRLGYFHNAGYFELEGDDFRGVFGLTGARRGDELAPYTEFVKLTPGYRLADAELTACSVRQLVRHLGRRPRENPIRAFRATLEREVMALRDLPQEAFHQYAFATLRQCGASFELAASYMAWLGARGERDLEPAREAFEVLSNQAKALQFKAARSAMLKRAVDFTPMLDAMESAWQRGQDHLTERYLTVR